MKTSRLARTLLHILSVLAVLAAWVVLDWHPTIRELGRLRSERGDVERKLKDYTFTVSSFVFPDKAENELFRHGAGALDREMPQMEDDETWSSSLFAWLRRQAGKDEIAGLRFLFSAWPGKNIGSGLEWMQGEVDAGWLTSQLPEIRNRLREAISGRFPWENLFFNPAIPMPKSLAVRPLAIVLTAPLPALLNFVNHISWGKFRLEIVYLVLEPGPVLYRAWLICRSSYLFSKPSAWGVKVEPGADNDILLIDPDSPLLWQSLDPHSVWRKDQHELVADSGWNRE
ncbi:MAG: hypothetical protein JXI33_00660 [Candidatus Aminicenantes bacterium]|nr:hypothetical protein [Candidatus Aminicenantes bacterium]